MQDEITRERVRKPKRRTAEQQQTETKAWLERILPPEKVTEERISRYAPYVGRYQRGSQWQRIADAMVRNDELPKHQAVVARHLSRQEALRRRNQLPGDPVELTDAVVERLREIIRGSWASEGRGPSWWTVGDAMGWSRPDTHDVLYRLRKDGVVSFTSKPGSLTVKAAGGAVPR